MNKPAGWSARLLLLALWAWLAVGCAHYQLGRDTALAFDSLYVAPVVSRIPTAQPQLALSRDLRETFANTNGLRLSDSPENAEARVEVTLIDLRRLLATSQSNDTARARSYDLELVALVSLHTDAGEVLFENREITARAEAFAFSSYQDAEAQAMTVLSSQLAQHIRNAVTSNW